jgi:hypothetical protein
MPLTQDGDHRSSLDLLADGDACWWADAGFLLLDLMALQKRLYGLMLGGGGYLFVGHACRCYVAYQICAKISAMGLADDEQVFA